MLIVDANVLPHTVNEPSRKHAAAAGWLTTALDGAEPVAFPWTVTLAFLRLSTHPAVFPRPLAPEQAAEVVERWLESPAALDIEPTRRHLPLLRGLLLHLPECRRPPRVTRLAPRYSAKPPLVPAEALSRGGFGE